MAICLNRTSYFWYILGYEQEETVNIASYSMMVSVLRLTKDIVCPVVCANLTCKLVFLYFQDDILVGLDLFARCSVFTSSFQFSRQAVDGRLVSIFIWCRTFRGRHIFDITPYLKELKRITNKLQKIKVEKIQKTVTSTSHRAQISRVF